MKKQAILLVTSALLLSGCGKVPKLENGKDAVVTFKNGDKIRVRISQFDIKDKALLIFNGINPNYLYRENYTPEDVSQEPTKHQNIEIL